MRKYELVCVVLLIILDAVERKHFHKSEDI